MARKLIHPAQEEIVEFIKEQIINLLSYEGIIGRTKRKYHLKYKDTHELFLLAKADLALYSTYGLSYKDYFVLALMELKGRIKDTYEGIPADKITTKDKITAMDIEAKVLRDIGDCLDVFSPAAEKETDQIVEEKEEDHFHKMAAKYGLPPLPNMKGKDNGN